MMTYEKFLLRANDVVTEQEFYELADDVEYDYHSEISYIHDLFTNKKCSQEEYETMIDTANKELDRQRAYLAKM